jgi:CBS domain-containing protein
MNIGQICTRKPLTVEASDPLAVAARVMCDRHIGSVIVVMRPADRPVPVGMITDRDIVRAQLEHHADLNVLSAEQVMTRDPLILEDQTPLDLAIGKLRARGVRRAPVVDLHGGLIGIVSTDDIVKAIANELGSLSRLIGDQPSHEGQSRPVAGS